MDLLDCGHIESEHSSFTRGYGTDPETGKKYCYACCAERDKERMEKEGKIHLYLICEPIGRQTAYKLYVDGKITNWPESLSIPCRVKRTKNGHNWGLTRYDAWFNFGGYVWHGVNYGEMTQVITCKRTKEKAR